MIERMRKGARERGGMGNRERERREGGEEREREREGVVKREVEKSNTRNCTYMYVSIHVYVHVVHETYQCTVQLSTEMIEDNCVALAKPVHEISYVRE